MNAPAPRDDPELAAALQRLSRAMERIAARIMENEERAHEEQERHTAGDHERERVCQG